MPNRTSKRTFLTRLSSLIIIKAAFVFAALWLVFYQAVDDPETDLMLSSLGSHIRSLADTLSVVLPSDVAGPAGALDRVRSSEAPEACDLAGLRVLTTDSVGHLSQVFGFVAAAIDSGDLTRTREAMAQFSDSDLTRMMLLPADYQIASLGSSRHSVVVQRLTLQDARPALLLAVARHDLFISNRSSLATVLVVLFVASGVITSLLVYSIRRRFQAPLRRLVRGMEETARGESFVMPEINEDHELDSLAASFNTMSRQLLQQRRDVLESNRLLQDSNRTLQESQLFMRTLLDSTPLCVIATQADGCIMLFNRQAGSDFRCTSDQAVGRNIRDFIAIPPHRDRRSTGSGTTAGAWAFEARCCRSTREYFPAYIISAEAHDTAGSPVANIYIIRDITESRHFQEMMVRLDRNYTRGEMAGDIAHEINNYLAILSGSIELMALVLDQGDREKIDKKLRIMKDTTDKIARFTDGLMDVPQELVAFEKTDLNQLVENVLAFLKPQNKFDRIVIESELSPEVPLVEVDGAQIQQLLVNFIYNAADAVGECDGDRRITVATHALSLASGAHARIEVRDTGGGVEPSNQPLLFKKRFTTKRKGHGIGLVTCKRIADSHGGEIGYESGAGTVFFCRIPVTHPDLNKSSRLTADPVGHY